MFKKMFSGQSVWGIVSFVGAGLSVIGGICSFIADPKHSEEQYQKIAKEQVKIALDAAKNES